MARSNPWSYPYDCAQYGTPPPQRLPGQRYTWTPGARPSATAGATDSPFPDNARSSTNRRTVPDHLAASGRMARLLGEPASTHAEISHTALDAPAAAPACPVSRMPPWGNRHNAGEMQ